MSLQALKRTIARVDIDDRPSGTAFLIGRKQVATALHVLANRTQVTLEFMEWPRGNRRRLATRTWRHLAGYDVAILELDKECPADVQPAPWAATNPAEGDRWSSFGFPAQLTDGHALVDQEITDPELRIEAWDLAILQLHTPSAKYDLGGFSGAPCALCATPRCTASSRGHCPASSIRSVEPDWPIECDFTASLRLPPASPRTGMGSNPPTPSRRGIAGPGA